MTTVVDSEAHFAARCVQIGLDDGMLKDLQKLKLDTIGKFAYAVGQPGVPLGDSNWTTWVSNTLSAASIASSACLRRLLFESQTIVLADLKQQVQSPAEASNRPVPEAERERRMAQLKASIPGVVVGRFRAQQDVRHKHYLVFLPRTSGMRQARIKEAWTISHLQELGRLYVDFHLAILESGAIKIRDPGA